ncbi:MAG: hypothetical protein AAFO03_20565 [Bacteroidota bacterium]
MEEQKQPQDNKAAWMERMAMESWQAEMVISGVAIFGSFQLLDGMNGLIDWCYFNLPEVLMGLSYFLCFYLLVAVAFLIMSFLVHFIIRSLWIAAIGLESVYPQGFRRENDAYTMHFMDQLIARFPPLREFNDGLDRVGSAVLAYALSFVMVFVGIAILLSGLLLLGYILASFMPDELAYVIVMSILALYGAVIFFNSILNSKSLREKPWVQRIQFPLSLFLGSYLTANIFARPQIYFSYTIRSNLENKRFWGMMIGMIIGVTIITSTFFARTQILALTQGQYHRYDDRVDRLYSSNYADESVDYNVAYIRPQIPSMTLRSVSELRLFIPMPERASRNLFEACSAEKPKRELASDKIEATREAFRTYRMGCYAEQLEIRLDDAEVEYIMKSYSNPHRDEPGLMLFFPNLRLDSGEHELEIRHLAVLKDGKVKTDRIPFFYFPED